MVGAATPRKREPDLDKLARPRELAKVSVEYGRRGRLIVCFCGARVSRSIVPHLKTAHPRRWKKWTSTFIRLRGHGYPLKRIMRLFRAGNDRLLFSWTVVERAIRKAVESGDAAYVPPPKKRVERWQPDSFTLQTTTIWDFPRRGDWAVHSGDYRGNWPPEIPRNLIERYTNPGDLVVDAFVGGGTTLIEAWLLGRPSIGLDVSKLAIQTSRAKVTEMVKLSASVDAVKLDPLLRPAVVHGDALRLNAQLGKRGVRQGQVSLLCAHPPYLDALNYTVDNPRDLSTLSDPDDFIDSMATFAQQARRALSPRGICAVLIGDVRKRGSTIPLGRRIMDAFFGAGFDLDNAVIKTQHRDRSSEFYVNRNGGGLLMAHEYLYILRNPGPT